MCCRRKQERLLAQAAQPRQRVCCGSRRQQRLLEAAIVPRSFQESVGPISQHQRPTMAALLAVGIGLGAEKLGRKISEKRLEKKEKKAIAEHEAIYGASSSSSSPSAYTTRERQSRTEKKREEARRELQAARQGDENVPQYASRRGSVNEARLGEEAPPPRYEEVVQQDARRGA